MTDAYPPLPNSSDLDKAAEAAVVAVECANLLRRLNPAGNSLPDAIV